MEVDSSDSLNLSGPTNELLNRMSFIQTQSPYVFGYAMAEDTAMIMDLLSTSDIQRLMPRNTVVLWGSRPIEFEGGLEQFALYGVRDNAELTGEVIEEASIQFDPTTNVPEVSMV